VRYLKCLKRFSGQALVEATLSIFLIAFFLFTIVWFASAMLTWQQISTAARYGTDLIAYTPFNEKYIKKDIENYLCSKKTVGRVLNCEKLDIKIDINDYKPVKYNCDISDIVSLNPKHVFNMTLGLTPRLSKKSVVEIKYSYEIPKIFKMMGKGGMEVKARSEILSGTGSQRALKRQRN